MWIAGDGEHREWLESQVQNSKMGHCVTFLGSLDPEQVRQRMQAADIFFLPSLWEGIALSIYEAMSTGLTVLGAKVGGQEELVTAGSGILIDSQGMDPVQQRDTYAELLKELINDGAKRKRLGKAARARIVKYFTLDQMAESMETSIKEAIAMHERDMGPEIS